MSNKLKNIFEYKLQNQIQIHKDGKLEFCNKIVLQAPSIKNNRERCIIKQSVLTAMNLSNQNQKQNVPTNISDTDSPCSEGEGIAAMLFMNLSSEKILEVMDAFKILLSNGAGKALDLQMTEPMIEKLFPDDLDNMLGEYIVNFLLPSWMKRLMKK